jgi:hypothetical protein
MVNKRLAMTVLVIVILFVGVTAGAISYYIITNEPSSKQASTQSQISEENETSNLRAQISSLNNQLANLTNIANNLTSANLETSLETHEMIGANSSYMGGLVATPVPYNYLWIEGSVTNTGKGYAYNAGLHAVAYAADGTLEINITVPLTGSNYGTDNATNAFVSKTYGNSSLTLEVLDSGQTTNVYINIFHEGLVTNWTVTPVCWTYVPNYKAIQNETLSSQVSYLKNQVSFLNAMITNLTTANLEASLAIKEYPATTQTNPAGTYTISYENSLFIVGSVTNTGEGVAYNAGLHVIGYTANGTLEMDMTVPLAGGGVSYYSTNYTAPPELSTLNSGYGYDSYSSSNSASIGMAIYTPDLVTSWTVTPVWTNSP